ncbi:hypothetical protein F8M49_19965 [Rhodococcus zopfii]|uniref:Uncharacterized protein n=1 Tax=Rhodococcus zopfii TaxID=43772 RepID=A0ABU3WSS2_9NOCA|nr:hypothetical protein [Rhodococcus zopfii]
MAAGSPAAVRRNPHVVQQCRSRRFVHPPAACRRRTRRPVRPALLGRSHRRSIGRGFARSECVATECRADSRHRSARDPQGPRSRPRRTRRRRSRPRQRHRPGRSRGGRGIRGT